jgi:hypothetical protein
MVLLTAAMWSRADGQTPRFFPDDPIQAMPAPLPVTKLQKQSINEGLDFLVQSSRWKARPATPAAAVNTLGDVPDSEWFTNRHGRRRMTRQELQEGGYSGDAPVPPFTVIRGKSDGIMPGLVMEDAKGRRYYVKSDPPDHPEMATAADAIVSKFLYAIGYNTPKNDVVDIRVSNLHLSPKATLKAPGGRTRPMTWKDVERFAEQAPHRPDGSFRIIASLSIEGENIGGFRFEGTRPDDPNDVTPHENRRDLRGLYVFSAWFNNTDVKPTNSLDTIVEQNGVRFIRHHLLDFGNALGSDGVSPKDARLGHEFVLPTPGEALKHIVGLGLATEDWERMHYPKIPGIGNFESALFEPDGWKPNYPNPAFLSRLPDDDFWAAKQVMAFTDDDIRAIVETARFSDPRATEYMISTLAERRNKIGQTFFSRILPLDHFRIENGSLLFDDLAVQYGFQAPRNYVIRWSRFTNTDQKSKAISGAESTQLPPESIPAPSGSYFSAVIDALSPPLKPVTVYVRKEGNSYKVVGIDHTW